MADTPADPETPLASDAASDKPPRKRRRRTLPWWTIPVFVVGALLAAELFARWVGPDLPRIAGADERVQIKADDIDERGSGSTDVVFLGSSETAGGLVPDTVDGATTNFDGAYNAALSGITLPVTQQWAERVVVPRLDPKVAVIGILPTSLADLRSEEATQSERQATAAYTQAIDAVDPSGMDKVSRAFRRHSALIRYRSLLRQPSTVVDGVRVALGGERHVPESKESITGELEWATETDPVRIRENTAETGEVYDYHSSSWPTTEDPVAAAIYNRFSEITVTYDHLDSLVASLRAQGVEPVLAIAPIDRAPIEAAGGDLSKLDADTAAIVQWAEDHQVPVLDEFRTTWPSDLFHDRNHLDVDGAQAWSTKVGTWLDELCASGDLAEACRGNG